MTWQHLLASCGTYGWAAFAAYAAVTGALLGAIVGRRPYGPAVSASGGLLHLRRHPAAARPRRDQDQRDAEAQADGHRFGETGAREGAGLLVVELVLRPGRPAAGRG